MTTDRPQMQGAAPAAPTHTTPLDVRTIPTPTGDRLAWLDGLRQAITDDARRTRLALPAGGDPGWCARRYVQTLTELVTDAARAGWSR